MSVINKLILVNYCDNCEYPDMNDDSKMRLPPFIYPLFMQDDLLISYYLSKILILFVFHVLKDIEKIFVS